MEKQQQILQMAKDICRVKHICNDVCKPISACDALRYAERAVEAGYVKQSEGEWVQTQEKVDWFTVDGFRCSVCGSNWAKIYMRDFKYCPNCGARMKGADNE